MKGLVRYSVHRPVTVNLLMIAMIMAGLGSAMTLRRQFFPEVQPELASIVLPYPGASPREIEQTLAIKVEDALDDIDEVDEITTTLAEGGGGIVVKFVEGTDPDQALDEIDRAIARLQSLPEESEQITAQLLEPRLPVIRLAVYGPLDDAVRKAAIRLVRDELRSLPGMGEVLLEGLRDDEVRVDVRSEALVRHGLSLPQVADRIRAAMRDLPGGTVRGAGGNVKVRTMGVAERAAAIREIVLVADGQGRSVRVEDVATVREAMVDSDVVTRFDGQPAAFMTVFKVGRQDIVQMAEMVRAYVGGRRGEPFVPTPGERVRLLLPGPVQAMFPVRRLEAWRLGADSARPLPAGASIATHSDLARYVEGRLNLLTRNALYGAALVFGSLLLFLNWRVAWWVGVGLTTSLLGTLLLMQVYDITLNLLTMFGLIVVLGLLVDDAIVVSENIQRRHDQGEPAMAAAEMGTLQVFWPVVATVLTSIVAFLPLMFIRGNIGDLLGALPLVVACALFMSLIESLTILPSHMAHSLAKRDRSAPGRTTRWVRRLELRRDALVLERLVPAFGGLLRWLLVRRYPVLAVAVAVLIVSVGLLGGRRVGFEFLPKSDSETVVVDMRLPIGSPITATGEAVAVVEAAAAEQPEFKSVATVVGSRANIDNGTSEAAAAHVAQLFVELKPVELRERNSAQVIQGIREALAGKIDQVERISFSEISGGPGGADIQLRASSEHPQQLAAAGAALKQLLLDYREQGVFDVADDNDVGQLELQIELTASGEALGFTRADVARQVRGTLFGIEAHTFAQRQEDIDVRVRLDEQTRRSLFAVENLWLISPAGRPVPLSEVATIREAAAFATIRRVDRRRTITVTAATRPGVSPEDITRSMRERAENGGPAPLDRVRAALPGVDIRFAGRQEQMADAFGSLPVGFAAGLVMIYIILAILFNSFTQPLVVLVAVPFAVIGAVWGHMLLGYQMTFLSLIGFVALAGIVVNDSLILVQFYNEQRGDGHGVLEALERAGRARVRAIFLTTITTVLGLTPLIMEQSFQATFLIPMAISIAGGLISATVITLVVLPCVLMVFDDLRKVACLLWFGGPCPAEHPSTIEPMSVSTEPGAGTGPAAPDGPA